MKNILYVFALLIGVSAGCKSGSPGPTSTIPNGPLLLDDGSVKVSIVASGVPDGVTDSHFTTALTGTVVTSDGKIYQTVDGGTTWVLRYANPVPEQPLRQVLFMDANVGYAVGGSMQCGGTGCVPPGGRVVKTTDGGATWVSVLQLSGVDIPSIAVNDAGELFAVANTATARILKSTDGGNNWQTIANEPFQLTKITFDRSLGFGTSAAGKVIRSTDRGSSWREVATFSYPYLNELAFAQGIGFCVEGYAKVYRTTDNGSTWALTNTSNYSALVVKALSPTSCLIFGAGQYSGGDFGTYNGSLRQTKDAGASWSQAELPGIGPVRSASFYTPTAGYAVSGKQLLSVQLY
jgi:photosystem II stability/assembly factor-like uncharacterized protein